MSLAARVAATTTLVIVLTVVSLSAVALLALGRSLDERDEDLLARAAARVSELDPENIDQTLADTPTEAGSTVLYVALVSPDGAFVRENTTLHPELRAALEETVDTLDAPTIVEAEGTDASAIAQTIPLPRPVELSDGVGTASSVTVAVPRDDRADILTQLSGDLARWAPLVALAGGLGAFLLARAALRPLQQLAERARRFGDGRREPLDGMEPRSTATEVAHVAAALDAAFRERWRAEDAIRNFVADASHELRTPLAAVHGWAGLYHEMAHTRPASTIDVDEIFDHISRETDRMVHLVDEMFALARLEADDPRALEPTDVVALTAELTEEIAALHPRHDVAFDHDRQGAGPTCVIDTDSVILGRAIRNLLTNAVTHTPDGTTVRASVDGSASETVRIEVVDDGPGLTPDELGRAGERFWRPERSTPVPGSGLGLAIVSASASSLGGRLRLAGAVGGGLRAVIELPQRTVSGPADNPQRSSARRAGRPSVIGT